MSACPTSVKYFDSSIKMITKEVQEVRILLEMCQGQNVLDLLNSKIERKTLLSETEVLKIFADVVVCVAKLHYSEQPIIHRDLKVSLNIIIVMVCNVPECVYTIMYSYIL